MFIGKDRTVKFAIPTYKKEVSHEKEEGDSFVLNILDKKLAYQVEDSGCSAGESAKSGDCRG